MSFTKIDNQPKGKSGPYDEISKVVTFAASNAAEIAVTQTLNKNATLGNIPLYYNDEEITFTITLNRSADGITNKIEIKDITLEDTFASIVNYKLTDVSVTTGTGGTPSLDSTNSQKLIITGLNLSEANPTITYTIKGKITIV